MMPDSVRAMTLATALGVLAIGSIYVYETAPLSVVAFALAALVVVAAWQPAVALGLTAAALPLYHQPFQTGETVLAPSELLLAAAAIGTVLRIAVTTARPDLAVTGNQRRAQDVFDRLATRFGVATFAGLSILTLIGLTLLAGVEDPDARSAGLREVRWTFVEPLLLVALLLWQVRTPRHRAFVLGAFAAGGLFVAVWSLADAATGGGVSVGGVVRASGPFPHPNALGLYLLRPVAFGAAFLLVSRSRSRVAWLLCGVGAAALVGSLSRSAALGLLVAALLLLPWMTRRMRMFGALAAAALSLALIVVAGDRAIGASGTDSLALRTDIWRSGLAMIRDRPVSGYGPDQFLYVYTPRYVDPVAWAERFTSHAHNIVIDSWVRVGIIGAVLAVLALARVARSAGIVVGQGESGRIDPLATAAIVTLAAAGAQALVDNGYFVHDLAMSAWLLAWAAFGRSTASQRRGALLHERNRDGRSGSRRLASL